MKNGGGDVSGGRESYEKEVSTRPRVTTYGKGTKDKKIYIKKAEEERRRITGISDREKEESGTGPTDRTVRVPLSGEREGKGRISQKERKKKYKNEM